MIALIIFLVICESILFVLNWMEFVEMRGRK